jgi:hypothetical protein
MNPETILIAGGIATTMSATYFFAQAISCAIMKVMARLVVRRRLAELQAAVDEVARNY